MCINCNLRNPLNDWVCDYLGIEKGKYFSAGHGLLSHMQYIVGMEMWEGKREPYGDNSIYWIKQMKDRGFNDRWVGFISLDYMKDHDVNDMTRNFTNFNDYEVDLMYDKSITLLKYLNGEDGITFELKLWKGNIEYIGPDS